MSDLCKRKIFKNERSDNRESGRLGKWGKDGKTFRGWFSKILFKFGRKFRLGMKGRRKLN